MTSGSETERLELASPEDRHTVADWEAAAAALLRKTGKLGEDDPDSDVWTKLTGTTLDGIEVPPLGTPATVADLPATGEPGAAPYTRGRHASRPDGWGIRVQYAGLDARQVNEQALLELDNGATSLWVALGDRLAPADLSTALDGVYLDLAPVVLSSRSPQAAAEALVAAAEEAGVDLHPDTNFGADPLADAVRDGDHPAGTGELLPVARLAREAGVRGVVVDATVVHDLGGSDAQELGYSLAAGAAYLRRLVDDGIPVDEALGLVEFRYAATDEQFPTIAKFRAARRCWARVAELSGASPEASAQLQHGVTSRPMMGKYDPWVNMLRTTVAAFGAGVGGADAVTVLPFDSPLGVPDAFGRRIARNTSSLLVHESHVATVADPAGGSFAVERLTDDLAREAWAELGRIEAAQSGGAGGIEAALADGSLRSRIEQVAATREEQVAHRTRPLTGISEFPNLAEELPRREPHPEADAVRRYGAAYEAMRDEPVASPVFLATMGRVAAYTARATFATNLLAAGGVSVREAGPTDGVDELVAAYDGQPVVVLAGSDSDYAAWGADAARALREAGARHVVLAGRPGERTVDPDLLDDSCAVGVDALRFLTTTREKLA